MKSIIVKLSPLVLAFGTSLAEMPVNAAVPTPAAIEAAKTPADHEALARSYEAEATSLEKLAAMHKNLARTYGQPGGKPWMGAQAKHCESVAEDLEAAAKEERSLAAEHHKMAHTAGP